MDYEEGVKVIEHKRQAFAALKELMHLQKIKVACGDIGEHYALWIIYTGEDGKEYRRQFSWSKQQPGHDGLRLQWIWDALLDYNRLREEIKQTNYEEKVQNDE